MKRNAIRVSVLVVLLMFVSIGVFSACRADTPQAPAYKVEYMASSGGTVTGDLCQTVQEGADATPVTAVPDAGYKFVKWQDGVTTATRTDTAVTANIKVTALFEERTYTYNVLYLTNGNGIIRGKMQQTVEQGADAAIVTAIPNDGYKFVKWSDGVTTATRTDTAVMQNINVTAIFAEKTYFTVTYTAGKHGNVSGKTEQTVAQGEDASTVTAYADYGYKFVRWSDGNTDYQRTDCNVLQDITVTAVFAERIHTVTYKTDGNGTIEGEAVQSVRFQDSATCVTAVPDEGYKFVRWSDWNYDATRTDTHITQDITVTAVFEPISYTVTEINVYANGNTYKHNYTVSYGETITLKASVGPYATETFLYWSDGLQDPVREEVVTEDKEFTAYFGYIVTYAVDGNTGGALTGPLTQKFAYNAVGESVTAVPQNGYVFGGWSDLCAAPTRTDSAVTRHTEYVAYFEPVQKTFVYDYGTLFKTPLATQITLTRNGIGNTAFTVPALAEYTFGGWYADADYRIKVADENGRPMLGYQTFLLTTNTLYAKWQKTGQEAVTYKILMVMTDEIHAALYSSRADRMVDVDYKMTAIERKILALISPKMAEYLNTWFEGRVTFEVDTYFTLQPVGTVAQRAGTEVFSGGVVFFEKCYTLETQKMIELQALTDKYQAVLNSHSLGDYEYLLHDDGIGGIAGHKWGICYLDALWKGIKALQQLYDGLCANDTKIWANTIRTYMHEFTHTVECRYFGDLYEFHKILPGGDGLPYLDAIRLYLLHRAEVNGEQVGIPPSYWENPAVWDKIMIEMT